MNHGHEFKSIYFPHSFKKKTSGQFWRCLPYSYIFTLHFHGFSPTTEPDFNRTVRREAGVDVDVSAPALDQGQMEPQHAGNLAEKLVGFFGFVWFIYCKSYTNQPVFVLFVWFIWLNKASVGGSYTVNFMVNDDG